MVSFRDKVFQVAKKIPKGKILTYKIVSQKSGCPKAWRVVGNILNKNRNPKIPCHRIIKSDGRIGGYRWGTKRKTSLLKREGVLIKNGRVAL